MTFSTLDSQLLGVLAIATLLGPCHGWKLKPEHLLRRDIGTAEFIDEASNFVEDVKVR